MQFVYKYMIYDREVIPEHLISHIIYSYLIDEGYPRSMPDSTGECSIPAVDTICIDFAFTCRMQVSDTIMNSIEKSFPIERAAFEYYGNPNHRMEIKSMKQPCRQKETKKVCGIYTEAS